VDVVRFADLFGPDGTLRRINMGIEASEPLDRIRPHYVKPNYRDIRKSPVIAMKPGASPFVINRQMPNAGPVVAMAQVQVNPKTAETTVVSEPSDAVTGVTSTVTELSSVAPGQTLASTILPKEE
jgi:hypothetical protein